MKIVVPLPPGSAPDFLSRIISASFQQQWGQTVIVENKPGGAQNVGAEQVARSAPDGHTLLTAPPPPISLNKFLFPNLKYDQDRFTPVTVICSVPNVLLVRKDLPATTLAQLIELARKPGGLNYASTGAGSTLHLTPDLPDVPSLSETWADFVSTTWFAVVAPPDTPMEIAEKLSAGIRKAFEAPEAAKRLADLRATAVLNTPAEAGRIFKQDSERWGAVIKANNIKGE